MSTVHQKTTEIVVVQAEKISGAKNVERVALFNEDGTPFGIAGDASADNARLDAIESRLDALEKK